MVGIETQSGYFTFYEIDVYGYKAAEEISSDIRFEGYQLGNDGASIRFIGSTDSLDYESLDLQITVSGDAERNFSNPTTKVFQVLNGVVGGAKKAVAATAKSGVVGEGVAVIDADYLFGYAITGIPAGTYTFEIIPVAKTYDGQTVKGKSATMTVTIGE